MVPRARVVGADIGGTFIDYVAVHDDGFVVTHKQLADPHDRTRAFFTGLAVAAPDGCERLVHGTTVATNALLERRGVEVGLVTTSGFEDVLAIGRQNRPELYALTGRRLPELVAAGSRLGVSGRITADGSVLEPLDEAAVIEAARTLAAAGVEAVAVSLLFSFLRPGMEQRVADLLTAELDPDVRIYRSSVVLPEYREYERTATTVASAYVGPLLDRYLGRLAEGLDADLQVMQSNGGVVDHDEAAGRGAAMVLSGPAGGVVGAFALARDAGHDDIITFDMGGTSTDVALCPGRLPTTVEGVVAEVPIRFPMLDVHTVGAGGGSIATIDAGGSLRVGPESAGADPGPAAYGRGTLPTVTDADVVLGRLSGAAHLAGGLVLDTERAGEAMADLGSRLGGTAEQAALGVLRVVHAAMSRAIRRVSVERGHDPRACTLVPFGGAGPMHAAELATELGITRILVPRHPGVQSAVGMATADEQRDHARTARVRLERGDDPRSLAVLWDPLEDRAARTGARLTRSADLRYVGQSFEVEVGAEPLEELAAAFDAAHAQRYGFARPDTAIEVVTVRIRATTPRGVALADTTTIASDPVARTVPVRFLDGPADAQVVARAACAPGDRVTGPALVVQPDTTTVIPPGWHGTVDPYGNLLLEPR